MSQLRLAQVEGRYIDSHVWLFTPNSFVTQLAELGALDLTSFWIDEVVPTPCGELEFYAVLRRLPRAATEEDRRRLRAGSIAHVRENRAEPPADPHESSVEQDSPPESPATDQDVADSGPLMPTPPPGLTYVAISDREERIIRLKRGLINTVLRRR